MTKLTENERKALNNACARLRETNLGTKIGNIEDFLDINVLKTDADTVSKAIDELFDKWANPLLNITIPPPGFFTLAGDADGNLWCYCNDETNPPTFEHNEDAGDLYLNIASEDGVNSYQVHVGNYIAVKHLNDYYKKTEVDTKLNTKSNVGHIHDDRYYTETEIGNNFYNKSEVDSKLNNKSNTAHTHDDRYYTETEINTKINDINSIIDSLVGFTAEIVTTLPTIGESGVMYLKLNTSASVEGNIYDEYIWVNNKFEKIGSTETTVDLSGYVTQTEMNTQLANKSNVNHGHLSDIIEINRDLDDGMWVDEYGFSRQPQINGIVYDHEKKLETIAEGANKTIVDSSLSSSSTNPVQNKVVNSALSGKAASSHTHDYNSAPSISCYLSDNPIQHGTAITNKSITRLGVYDRIQIPYKASTREGYKTEVFKMESFILRCFWRLNSLGSNSAVTFVLWNPESSGSESIEVTVTPQQGRTWIKINDGGSTITKYDSYQANYANDTTTNNFISMKVTTNDLSCDIRKNNTVINPGSQARNATSNPDNWCFRVQAGAWSSGTAMDFVISPIQIIPLK